MPRSKAWTIANWVMALVFLFSVVVQVNDPDPIRWVLIYGAALVVTVLEARRRAHWLFAAAVGAIALVAAFIIANGLDMVPFGDLFAQWEMSGSEVEETREVGGLWIIAGWMLIVTIVAWRRARLRSS